MSREAYLETDPESGRTKTTSRTHARPSRNFPDGKRREKTDIVEKERNEESRSEILDSSV